MKTKADINVKDQANTKIEVYIDKLQICAIYCDKHEVEPRKYGKRTLFNIIAYVNDKIIADIKVEEFNCCWS